MSLGGEEGEYKGSEKKMFSFTYLKFFAVVAVTYIAINWAPYFYN